MMLEKKSGGFSPVAFTLQTMTVVLRRTSEPLSPYIRLEPNRGSYMSRTLSSEEFTLDRVESPIVIKKSLVHDWTITAALDRRSFARY